MSIFEQTKKLFDSANSAARETPPARDVRPPKVAANSMASLEKRYVFDAAIATELQHFADHGFTPAVDGAGAGGPGASLVAAAQALSDAQHSVLAVSTSDMSKPVIDRAVESVDKAAGVEKPAIDPVAIDISSAPASVAPHEIAFIDGSLPDIGVIIADLPKGVEAVIIDPHRDGVAQIATYLEHHADVSAIHLVAHGSQGEMNIGSSVLDANSINTVYKAALQSIGTHLTANADILIYGCDFAAGSEGAKTEALIAQLTGADVAAADHVVGGSAGASWTLDKHVGTIDAQGIVAADWNHELLTISASDGSVTAYAGVAFNGSLSGHGSTDTGAAVTYFVADASGNPIPTNTNVITPHGTVRITDSTTGAYVFTANAGFTGSDSFRFVAEASDGTGTVQQALAIEAVTIVQAQIVTQNDSRNMIAGTPLSSSLVGEVVSNPLANPLTYSLTSATTHGTVNVNPDGTFSYTPGAGYVGSDSFTWTATDPSGLESPSTSTMWINVQSPLSTVSAIAAATIVNQPQTLPIDGHYLERTSGATVTFALDPATPVQNGTLQINPDRTITYTATNSGAATSNSGAIDSFNIIATDSNGYTTVIPIYLVGTSSGHAAPSAGNDQFVIMEGQRLTSITPSASEINAGSTPVTFTYVYDTQPAKGTLTVNANGTYNYVPEPGPAGLGSFTFQYTATDNFGQTATGTETIIVDSPAIGTTGAVKYAAPGAAVPINLESQSSHSQTDPWVVGGSGYTSHLAYTIVNPPLHGTLSVDPANPVGGLIYRPNPGFSGVDSFTYDMFDGYHHLQATDTIISPARIFASSDLHVTAPSTPYTGSVSGISGSPSGGIVWQETFAPSNGTATLNSYGTYTYTPNAGFHGIDRFGYSVADATGHLATAYIDILVSSSPVPGDIAPTSTSLPDRTNHDSNVVSVSIADRFTNNNTTGSLTFYASGLPVGLSIDPATGVISGTIDHTASQTVVNGQYEVTVLADDGGGGITQQHFTWTVVNDAPAVIDHTLTTPFNTVVNGNVSTGSTDPNAGDALIFSVATTPAHGTVTMNASGTYSYTPVSGYTGTDTFTYLADDGKGGTAIATETIFVGPKAVNDGYTTPFSTAVGGNAATADTYAPGSVFTATSAPAHGVINFNPNGTYTYTPGSTFAGTDTFFYRVTDPNGQTSMAMETITITPPSLNAVNDSYSTPYNTPVNGVAATADTYAPGSVFTATSAPSHGTLSFNPNGTYTYTPASNFAGTDTFIYKVTDPTGQISMATETITIAPPAIAAVNDSYTTAYNTPLNGNTAAADTFIAGSVFTATSAPAHGTISFNPNGSYTYTPASNFAGTDTFTYKVTDPTGQVAIATETITITPPAIAAVNDSYTTPYNTPVQGNAAGADTFVAGSVFAATSAPAHGTLSFNPNGSYTYTPASNFAGTDTFTYRVTDPTGQIATATETITITPPAIAAVNDSYLTPFNTPVSGNAAGADTFVAGSVFAATSAPAHGTISFNPDGSYTYTPTAGYTGTDTFTYKVTDPTGQIATATETIVIGPKAINDGYTTPYSTPLSGNAATADTYVPGSVFTATSAPAHGVINFNPDGTYTYTPGVTFAGTDTFTYKVTDPSGQVSTAVETITITPPAIAAVNDSYTTPYNTPVNGNAATADTYVPGSVFAATSAPMHGTLNFNADGTYTYTPSGNFAGTDTFVYKVTDPTGNVAMATETITITPPPIAAVNDSYTTPFNTPVNGNAAAADTFVPGSVFAATSAPSHGAITFNADGTYTYTPGPNFTGTDTFFYKVTDPTGKVAMAMETITVTPPPIAAVNDSYTTPFNTPVNGNAATGDTYVVGSVFAATSAPAHGSVTMNPDGTYTYTPTAGFTGTDTFIYKVTDTAGQVRSATETITVGPNAVADGYTTPFNTPLNNTAAAADTYVPGSVFAATSAPANGSVTMNPDGTYTYTPTPGFTGTDTFSYKVTDPNGLVSTAIETIKVGPNAVNDTVTTPFNTPVNGNAAMADVDLPGSVFTATSTPAHGSVTMNPDGTYTYTPTAGFTGTDTFTYKVTDPNGLVATATETVKVGPNAVADGYTTPFNTPVNGAAATADTYAPGSLFAATSAPANGSVTMNPDGTYTYTPTPGFTGTDTFTYKVTDPNGLVSTAIETVKVGPNAVNDTVTTPFNTPVNGNAATADVDLPGSVFTATSTPAHGTVTMNPDGTYTYTPTPGFTGTDTFTYKVTDPNGLASTATETVKVGPNAVADGYTTPFNTPVNGMAATADTYAPGSLFTATSNPANGSVTMNADGSYIYAPAPGFTGTDTFTYKVTDPNGLVSTATETVKVGPNAVNDTVTTPFNTPVNGNAAAADINLPGSVFATTTMPAHGTVTMNPDGTYTYTPTPGFTGADTFTYKVTDPNGLASTATETVNVGPNAINDTVTTAFNTPVNGAAAAADTYLPGSVFAATSVPTHGSVTMNPDGTYTYTPTPGYTGTDTFTYKVTDPNGLVSTATETIKVGPNALNDTVTTPFNTPVNGNAATADVDLPGSIFATTTMPAHGTVSMNPDGTYTYTPTPGFTGTDTFSYKVTDPNGLVSIAIETIKVGPEAVSDTVTTPFNTPVNGTAATADTYAPGSVFTATSNPANGSVTMNADGSYIYAPAPGFTGTDTFSYKVTDPNGLVSIATETVKVGPHAVNDTLTTPFNTPVNGNAATADVSLPGSVFTPATLPAHGTVAMNPDGTYTYTPTPGFTGTDTFTYKVTDPNGLVSVATETVTVSPPPLTAVDDVFTTAHNTPVNGNAAAGDTFYPGSTFTALSPPAHGTVTMKADGTYTYTPNPTFSGVDTFTYKITDPAGNVVTAMETINVAPAAPPVALNDAATTKYHTPVTGSLTKDATDPAGYPLTFGLVTGAAHGTVTVHTDGTYTYTPNVGFVGVDTFTYSVDNGNGGSATAIVNLTVLNPPPVAVADSTLTTKDHAITGTIAHDVADPVPGTTLTFSVKSPTSHGALTVNPDGTFNYVPATGWIGVDSFVYQVSDGRGGTASNTVTITVNPDFRTDFRCITTFENYSNLGLVPVRLR